MKNRTPSLVVLVVLVALVAFAPPTYAAECELKLVFKAHCLGGVGEPVKGRDLVVSVHGGRIARVERLRPGTMLSYADLLKRLRDKYGYGDTRDSMPSGYEGRERTAIVLGRGRMEQVWQQPGWTVRLLWEGSNVILRYSHDQLEAAMLEDEL